MSKFLLLFFPLFAFSFPIKVEQVQYKALGKVIQSNAVITQLSEQKQSIVSRLSGHLEMYYVKLGQSVSKGDKVALIESIELSKMTAQYLALVKQLKAANTQKNTAIALHKKGLASQNDVSNTIIALENIHSQINTLVSQLGSLGIDAKTLTLATDKFILYAHADGVVGTIIAPLHSNVNAQTKLITLVQQNSYYATAFLSYKDAMGLTEETKGWIHLAGQSYDCHFVQLLPNIDKETQRAKVLFSIDNSPKNLLIGLFTQIDISIPPSKNVLMIKKSALTLFKGEWVVFIEKEHNHEKDDVHEEEAHKEETPYEIRVVKIIASVGEYVSVKGLSAEDKYVADGVYFVKSMLLKSSLAGHGH